MEPTFRLRFLGAVQIAQDDKPVRGFESRKALALLGYLAAQSRPIPREQLVDLFWGDKPEKRGRANLSWVLNKISTLLPGCLQADRHSVQFQQAAPYWLDIDAFEHLETQRDPGSLAAAVALYRGEFLEGLYLEGCPEFELWVVTERERWRQRVVQVLEGLITCHGQRGECEESLRFAQQLLALEPWREETHRQVMRLLARSGQRSAALAQYETCCHILAQELGIGPLPETTALYERIQTATQARKPNLPTQPTRFVGREEDLAQMVSMLNNPECRLLTILGPGGVGKTRLALQAAADQTEAFLEGVFFIPLAPLSAAEHLTTAIAEAVGFSFAGQDDPKHQLLNYLRGKEMLLILDNFEHLLEGAAFVAEILRKAPEITLLVTSRARLNVEGEHLFPVAGMDCPESPPEAIADTAHYSSIELFLTSAQRVQPSFELTTDNLKDVARICRLVEGLPLGILLAAAWVEMLSPGEIAAEISQGLDFLETDLRDVPERQRSMRAVFDHSWNLLAARERAVTQALSVFRGDFTREAAQQVTGASLRELMGLVNKSLLHRASVPPTVPKTEGRYEVHELLRQYAAEKLAATPEASAVAHDRHCTFYAAFLERWEADFVGARPAKALAAIRMEIANVREAWRWAVKETKLEAIKQGLNSLSRYYLLTGPFQEGSGLIERAVDRVRALVDQGKQAKQEVGTVLSRLLAEQANLLNQQGIYEQAIAAAQAAVDQAQASQAINPEALAHLQWGHALWCRGNYVAAQSQFESALDLAQGASQGTVKAKSLRYLGNLFEHQSDFAKARAYLEQALHISQEIGDQQEKGRVLNDLGMVANWQGDYAQAQAYYEQGLSTSRAIGDLWLESIVLSSLGLFSDIQEDFAQAETYYEQSLRISRDLGDRRREGMSLSNLGLLSNRQGDFAKARSRYEQALHIQREIGDRRNECCLLSNLGLLSHRQGDYAAARKFSKQALDIARDLGNRRLQGYALMHLGHALAGLGHLAEADSAYQDALDIRRELGQRNLTIETLAGLARVSLAQGDLVRAQEQVDEILTHLETGNLDGTIEPLWIYLTCYQVLRANDAPRAQGMLSEGHHLLHEQAIKISDEEMRRSFLENVAVHREIVAAFESQSSESRQT